MGTIMSVGDQMERWLADNIPPELLLTPLPDEIANEVVERLKQEADRYWSIDAERSIELADRIIAIGKTQNNSAQIALGWMARGDAYRFLGKMEEAWQTLEHAGNIFEAAGDKVGWARTRIGRLYLAVKLSRVKETLLDGKEAQKIFKLASKHELLVRLNTARGVVYASLGRLHRALRLFNSTLAVAKTLGTAAQQHLVGMLDMDIGVAHDDLGNYSQALVYYERAQSIFAAENETRNIALVELNIAYIAQAQSRYRHSLRLLHDILERGVDQFPMEYLAIKRDMTECYLRLNRYTEALELAQEVVDGYRTHNSAYETARSLLHLATAEAELGHYPAAYAALKESENIFATLEATSWQAIVRLRSARIALKQKNIDDAYQEAVVAAADFEMLGQHVNYAAAVLLKGQALLAHENSNSAFQAASQTLNISQHYNVPSLRYAGHLLLGQVAEAQQKTGRAIRHYQAAAATIERVQRSLTITLRPGFLEDKGEASRALIALYLQTGQSRNAFETLERAKSQVLMGYLANREELQWTINDAHSQLLIEELNGLRAEHQWFYRLAHEPSRNGNRSPSIAPGQALAEVATRERRMRAITEKLYLLNDRDQQVNRVPRASLSDIQCTLNQGDLLIEFYSDGVHVWAFVLDQQTTKVFQLSLTIEKANQLLSQLQTNVGAALGMTLQMSAYRSLTNLAQRILQHLHALLIEPLLLNQRNLSRLVIVPYGSLHFLPFHLLYDGSKYLIEKHEVVILPAASLATRAVIRRSPGALVLAHSYAGRLPDTLAEGQMVQQLFGGTLYVDEEAKRKALQTSPSQILHIAAHGEHRLDQPDLSYLHLADGQLYADDLLQEDLSYELVTLSGCETGRANVAASDELIGLGRGVLYAGAGALVVSQWRVADDSTLEFMKRMYEALHNDKKSKAAAIREAQQSLLDENRQAHPATWGSFRLIGNAEPLSSV
jgi:CHAT domain-containing protein/tetratricopeptide (TPR) repeat protein